jgi:hypothetical protein
MIAQAEERLNFRRLITERPCRWNKISLKFRAIQQETSTANISAALVETPRENACPPPGCGAQARYDFVVFGSRYGTTKHCQLNL